MNIFFAHKNCRLAILGSSNPISPMPNDGGGVEKASIGILIFGPVYSRFVFLVVFLNFK